MTNFQSMLQEIRESARERNVETVRQYNAMLADKGISVNIEPSKSMYANADSVTVSNNDQGYFAGNMDMDPEQLLWRIAHALDPFDIKLSEL